MTRDLSTRSGQSLMEVLLAVGIGAFLMIAGAGVIVPALTVNGKAARVQEGTLLAYQLLNNVKVWSEGSWNNILTLATGTSNEYYLMTTASPYAPSSGSEAIAVGTSTYTRYFYVTDGYRDTSRNPTTSTSAGNVFDPSTKLITVVYGWPGGPTYSMAEYLTRHQEETYDQTDWSGGPGMNTPQTTTNSMFATSSGIDYATDTGSLYLKILGY